MINKETFSQEIKKEIVNLDFDINSLKILISPFFINNLSLSIKSNDISYHLTSSFDFIINFLYQSIVNLYSISLTKNKEKNNDYFFVDLHGNLDLIKADLLYDNLNLLFKRINTISLKRAFIAGTFLSCGSINEIKKDKLYYHLELWSNNYHFLLQVQKILINFKIFSTLLKKKTSFILYIKKAEEIGNFLRLINASNAYLQFENIRIKKDFTAQINRLNNLNFSNISKATQSGLKQVKMIEKIITTNYFHQQNSKFKNFCYLRLKNKTISLNEMATKYNKMYKSKISKSCIYHYVIKLTNMYQLLVKQKK